MLMHAMQSRKDGSRIISWYCCHSWASRCKRFAFEHAVFDRQPAILEYQDRGSGTCTTHMTTREATLQPTLHPIHSAPQCADVM